MGGDEDSISRGEGSFMRLHMKPAPNVLSASWGGLPEAAESKWKTNEAA